jgi:hypothetical protein
VDHIIAGGATKAHLLLCGFQEFSFDFDEVLMSFIWEDRR